MRTAFLASAILSLAALSSAQHHPAAGGARHQHQKKYIWGGSVIQDGDEGMPPVGGGNQNMLSDGTTIPMTTPGPAHYPTPPFPFRPPPSSAGETAVSEGKEFTLIVPRIGLASEPLPPSPTTTSAAQKWYLAPPAAPAPATTTPSAAQKWYLAPPAAPAPATTTTRAPRLTYAQRKEAALAAAGAAQGAFGEQAKREKRWYWGPIIQDPTPVQNVADPLPPPPDKPVLPPTPTQSLGFDYNSYISSVLAAAQSSSTTSPGDTPPTTTTTSSTPSPTTPGLPESTRPPNCGRQCPGDPLPYTPPLNGGGGSRTTPGSHPTMPSFPGSPGQPPPEDYTDFPSDFPGMPGQWGTTTTTTTTTTPAPIETTTTTTPPAPEPTTTPAQGGGGGNVLLPGNTGGGLLTGQNGGLNLDLTDVTDVVSGLLNGLLGGLFGKRDLSAHPLTAEEVARVKREVEKRGYAVDAEGKVGRRSVEIEGEKKMRKQVRRNGRGSGVQGAADGPRQQRRTGVKNVE
ncbi:hypothetical protein JCM11251_006552 [Rhodosporidiobolus azoricus]